MSAEAWSAALAALWDAAYPLILGFGCGWYFRGWAPACRRRAPDNELRRTR